MADHQGMNIEVFFRQMFEIDDSVEIVPLMEAAISVVASKHPQELLKRRKRIIKTLMFGQGADSDSEEDESNDPETTTAQKATFTTSKIDEERPEQQHHDIKIPARRKSDTKIVSCTKKVDEKKAMEVKLEASTKRKLQDGYAKNQQERTKKRIQIVDLKDIPAPQMKRMKALDAKNIPTPPQKKNSSARSRVLKKLSRPRTQLMRPLAY